MVLSSNTCSKISKIQDKESSEPGVIKTVISVRTQETNGESELDSTINTRSKRNVVQSAIKKSVSKTDQKGLSSCTRSKHLDSRKTKLQTNRLHQPSLQRLTCSPTVDVERAEFNRENKDVFPFTCEHPGHELKFSDQGKLKIHECWHTSSEATYLCRQTDCGKMFCSHASLQAHGRSHTGERPFACQVLGCGKAFRHKSDLTVHTRRHKGEKPFICAHPDCGKAFTTSSELKGHQLTHSANASYTCEICGKQYISRKGIRDHRIKVHSEGPKGRYHCPYEGCCETFHRQDMYELHLCQHSSDRRFSCEKCGKTFGCKRYLDVHYKVHQKNEQHALNPPKRDVQCQKEGCEKNFTTHISMKHHFITVHLGHRPKLKPGVFYSCPKENCGQKFPLKSTLARHDRLVHRCGDYKLNRKIVRYRCSIEGCDDQFNRKNLLEFHLHKVHGVQVKGMARGGKEQEAMCHNCGLVMMAEKLHRHGRLQHGADWEGKVVSPFICQFKNCESQFTTVDERRSHVRQHKAQPMYKCEVENCNESFYLLKNFDNHLWQHCRKPSSCHYQGCNMTFEDQLALAKHSKLHYNGKMVCCWRNCGVLFISVGTLKQHLIAHSRSLKANFGSDFICTYCDRVFSSKHGLSRHIALHDLQDKVPAEQTAFICEESDCHQRFSEERDYNNHVLHHHTSHSVVCEQSGCGQVFSSLLSLVKHGKVHNDNKYKCPWEHCDNHFTNFHFLKKHLLIHLLTQPSEAVHRTQACTKCDLAFKTEENLVSHMKKHTEKSKYVCPECGKKFRYNHLKRHMLIHMKEKAHKCLHCGVRYSTTNGLRFHILKVHNIGEWPLKCEFCGKGFISGSELRRHLPSHTKEKPFPCEVCRIRFATHTGLKGHIRKHTGEKFVCDVSGCSKVYTNPLSLRGHKAQHEGFSKSCQYCEKMYSNPYTHNCKAAKRRNLHTHTDGQAQPFSCVLSDNTRLVKAEQPPTITSPQQASPPLQQQVQQTSPHQQARPSVVMHDQPPQAALPPPQAALPLPYVAFQLPTSFPHSHTDPNLSLLHPLPSLSSLQPTKHHLHHPPPPRPQHLPLSRATHSSNLVFLTNTNCNASITSATYVSQLPPPLHHIRVQALPHTNQTLPHTNQTPFLPPTILPSVPHSNVHTSCTLFPPTLTNFPAAPYITTIPSGPPRNLSASHSMLVHPSSYLPQETSTGSDTDYGTFNN